MAVTDTNVVTRPIPHIMRIEWGPIIAGTLAASALAFVLHGFATAIGMSLASTAPTWRDASFALVLLTGLYLLIVGVLSYGLGAYVAGRMRTRFDAWSGPDGSYSDGVHGLLVWALATLLTALLGFAAATASTRLAAPSGAPSQSVAGENIIAYDIDKLFRGHRPGVDITLARAEAARILLTASSHRGVVPEDQQYLARLVEQNAGVAGQDAQRRVNEVIAAAKDNIERARHSGAILAFMAAAVAALGAAIAWFAAEAAGRHRQGLDTVPDWLDWGRDEYHYRRPTTKTMP
jgi:hypothetical protein